MDHSHSDKKPKETKVKNENNGYWMIGQLDMVENCIQTTIERSGTESFMDLKQFN